MRGVLGYRAFATVAGLSGAFGVGMIIGSPLLYILDHDLRGGLCFAAVGVVLVLLCLASVRLANRLRRVGIDPKPEK